MKLNVGCGATRKDGFVGVDLFYRGVDVCDDARTLATFADNSVEEIYAAHVLEHLGKYDGPRALAAWRRVLIAGGKLTVIVPDIPKLIRRWLEFYDRHDPRVWEFRSMTLWGNQVHEGEYHKWGYDIQTLRRALAQAGFQGIQASYSIGLDADLGDTPDACITAEAYA